MKRRSLRAVVAAFAFLGGAAWVASSTAVPTEAGAADLLKAGDEVPDLVLRMADGTDAKLSAREGNVVLLFFYGTWGRKSPAHAKKVDELRKARAKQKLWVVGIARDGTRADARKFGEDHSLGFPQAADPKDEVYARFAEKGLPWIAIVDAREAGKRTLRHSAGGLDEEAVGSALANLLGKTDAEREREEREKAEKAAKAVSGTPGGGAAETPAK